MIKHPPAKAGDAGDVDSLAREACSHVSYNLKESSKKWVVIYLPISDSYSHVELTLSFALPFLIICIR